MTLLTDVRVLNRARGWQAAAADFLAELGADVLVDADADADADAASADIVILDRPGGDLPERLLSDHPHLVILVLTDFGRTGPYAAWRGSDAVLMALGGVLSRSGHPDQPPVLPPRGLAYGTACVHATFAALVALLKARDTGHGEIVDVSAHEAVVHGFDPGFGTQGSAAAGRSDSFPRGRPDASTTYPVFECADGQVRMCLLAPRQWRAMYQWLGQPAEFADPAFDTIRARFAASDRLLPLIAALFARRTRKELTREAAARGIPLAALLTVEEALNDEHFRATGAVSDGQPTGYVTIDGQRASVTGRVAPTTTGTAVANAVPAAEPVEMEPRRPLAGVRVLDMGVIVFGAELSRLLADQGAEVIKVENPGFPDGLRQSSRDGAINASFAWGHRNKESLGIDLRTTRGGELMRDLIGRSDILLSNFKPGTMESLGLDAATLSALNPRLIVCESSAFGSGGPWSDRLGYGPLVRAATGITNLWRETGSPCDDVTVYPDHVAAHVAAAAVLAALVARQASHRGTTVGVAQSDVALMHVMHGDVEGQDEVLACLGDDEWLAVTIRPGDVDALQGLLGHPGDVHEGLAAWAAVTPARTAMQTLQERGIAAGAMVRLPEELSDPQLAHRRSFTQLTHPALRMTLSASARPALFSSLPDADQRPAPSLGRDTRAIAARVLALSDDDLDSLLQDDVLHQS